jgi:signal transduction histidine kinase/ActR/RegA family two-component response regulator
VHAIIKLKRLWLGGFGICIGLIALLLVLAWSNLKASAAREDAQQRETHTREVLLAAKDTLSALQDAETGQRGYLLTMRANYLEPYTESVKQFGETIDRLATLTQDNAGQQARIAELRNVAAAKLKELAATVSLEQSGDRMAALALVVTEQGKSLMDEARRILQAIKEEEEALLAVRHRAARDAATQDNLMSFVLAAMGTMALLIAMAATIWALWSVSRLQAARATRRNLEIRVTKEVHARVATQALLVQAEKLTALGQLAGGIAHDFNNILQAVSGGASLIGKHADEPAKVRRFSTMVELSAQRGTSITRRLLVFARRGELRTEAIHLPALLDGLHEVLTHTLGASYAIRIDAETGLLPVLADRGQLETVLVNLATNARDAMPSGGTITLSANLEKVTVPAHHPVGLASGTYGRLSVEDTGTGMDRATLARIMEPFFTTKGLGQGTGLGLPMARGFAEQLGGGLAVASELDQGTTVTLWLPVTDAPATPHSEPEYRARARQSEQPRVLLVDDEALVRQVLAEQLGDSGYDVVEADCGETALALLDAGESIDLIVADLFMPGISGVALLQAVHVRRPRLPAILLTGCAGDAMGLAVGGAISGTFSLLRKPVSGPHLADRVAALLEALAIS